MGKFSNIYANVSNTSHSGMVAWASVNCKGLRDYLISKNPNEFLADPVFEATYPYFPSEDTMDSLSKSDVLSSTFVNTLDEAKGEYRFPRNRRPYQHQIEAWKWLKEPGHSAIVSSGTGSGKTECFLFPIFDSLCRQIDQDPKSDLEGVQALVLYPLNALINSQKKRLSAWAKAKNKSIRFCLYNSLLAEHKNDSVGSEVTNRKSLRNSPPPILLTNTTMLEYMLIRSEDTPILEKSKGKLRWIVLDEAHTYLGSNSAELSLLLRRTLAAFDVDVSQVQFVATSATISGSGSADELRNFLASIAGVESSKIRVVTSTRQFPEPHTGNVDDSLSPNISAVGNKSLVANLIRNKFLTSIGDQPRGIVTLSQVKKEMTSNGVQIADDVSLIDLVDQCSTLITDVDSSFLPLRGHFFHRVVDGLWACSNSNCNYKQSMLSAPDSEWHFGQIFDELRHTCDCSSVVYELAFCNECGTVVLESQRVHENSSTYLKPIPRGDFSRFGFDLIEEVNQDGKPDQNPNAVIRVSGYQSEYSVPVGIDTSSGVLSESGPDTATIYLIPDDKEAETTAKCPQCNATDSSGHLFKGFSIGAPYFISAMLPEILEQLDPMDSSVNKPFGGRRALCFNDSRSGTASLALRGHSESERQFVRSFCYHRAVAKSGSSTPAEHLVELKSRLENASDEFFKTLLQAEIDKITVTEPLSFQEFSAGIIQSETGQLIRKYYNDLEHTPEWALNEQLFSFVMFAREFARRPLRANTVETLGLLSFVYLPIANLKSLPESVKRLGFSLDQWKRFLHSALDSTFRNVGAIDTKGLHYRELMLPTYGRSYCFIEDDIDRSELDLDSVNCWPQLNKVRARPNRLILITAIELGVSLDKNSIAEHRDQINLVLKEAWNQIRNSKVLVLDTSSDLAETSLSRWRLDLTQCGLEVNTKYCRCPVTRKSVRPIKRGVSPFLVLGTIDDYLVTDYDLPVFHRGTEGNLRQEVLAFLTSTEISYLRNIGVWTVFQDRIVADRPYFETVEHSAGVDRPKLEFYEKQFELGNVNVLNCSTTMEMGVDITGVQAVVMNNVPPHPANYLQRTGRAGRRGERQAIAFTMCRANPHELSVFENPLWPFIATISAPTIRLDSVSIVQRHVNALLLQRFIQIARRAKQVPDKLKTGHFFGVIKEADGVYRVADSDSLVDRFIGWLSNSDVNELVGDSYRQLVIGSILQESSVDKIRTEVRLSVSELRTSWKNRFTELNDQLSELETDGTMAVFAVKHQLHRHCETDILQYLTHEAWLPVHGFPTSVSTFDTTNHASDKSKKAKSAELVSRSSSIAIREYAPGAEIVQAGNTFVSAGLSMNWNRPATVEDNVESQNIYDIEVCQDCGTINVSNVSDIPECGCRGRRDRYKAIEPLGYCVDYSKTPLTVTHPHQQNVQLSTFVMSSSPIVAFGNPECGEVRVSPEAKVITVCRPGDNDYFEICLSCGRMSGTPGLGKLTENHKKLRSLRDCENPRIWRERKNVVLSAKYNSSAVEFRLAKTGTFLSKGASDTVVARTIGTALVLAMADLLGVDRRELRFTCTRGNRTSIVLFDDGATGYVSTFREHDQLVALFKLAQEKLRCPAECDKSCSHCLIDFSNRWESSQLDRKLALNWMDEQWLTAFESVIPATIGSSQQSLTELSTPLISSAIQRATRVVRLFGNISTRGGDLIASSIPSITLDILKQNIPVEVLFDADPRSLERSDQRRLASLLETFSGALRVGFHGPVETAFACVVAEVHKVDTLIEQYSVSSTAYAVVDEAWGVSTEIILARKGASFVEDDEITWVSDFGDLYETKSNVSMFRVTNESRTPQGIAKSLIENVIGSMKSVEELLQTQRIVKLQYSDRYIRTSMVAAILVEIHKVFNKYSPDVVLDIITLPTHCQQESDYEFMSDLERDTYINKLWEIHSLAVNLIVNSSPQHERFFTIVFSTGSKVTVLLDNGVSYWCYIDKNSRFIRIPDDPNAKMSTETTIRAKYPSMPVFVVIE